MTGERRTAALTLLLGAAVFAVVAAVAVPWHPVPGGAPPPAQASSAFGSAYLARAHEYATPVRWWAWSSLAVQLVVAVGLGLSGRVRRVVRRLPGRWWLQVVGAVALLLLVARLVTLPFSVLIHRRAMAYGLTHQAWGAYALDLVKGELVSIVTTAIGALVLVGCARRWTRRWPLVAGSLAAGLVLLGSFAYPLLVEPLFNRFTPLPDGPLRAGILRLADREHVQVSDVLVADASRRTTTLNAYVSGFGGTRRVVLYDTVVDDLPRRQVLSIVAHELAHARHDDVLLGSVLGAAGAFAGVGLLGLAVSVVRRREGEVSDPGTLPLVLALTAVGTVLSSPLTNGISRQIETRADVDGLLATRDTRAMVVTQERLATRALSDPSSPAWAQWWWGSHPTALERVAIARQLGERLGQEPARK